MMVVHKSELNLEHFLNSKSNFWILIEADSFSHFPPVEFSEFIKFHFQFKFYFNFLWGIWIEFKLF